MQFLFGFSTAKSPNSKPIIISCKSLQITRFFLQLVLNFLYFVVKVFVIHVLNYFFLVEKESDLYNSSNIILFNLLLSLIISFLCLFNSHNISLASLLALFQSDTLSISFSIWSISLLLFSKSEMGFFNKSVTLFFTCISDLGNIVPSALPNMISFF